MKEHLEALRDRHQAEFNSYILLAKMSEDIGDKETFSEMIKQAAGHKMMLDKYKEMLYDYE